MLTDPDALRVTDLTVPVRAFALHDVTLSVPAGSVMGLVGPNGSGKTTLIRTVLGMRRPTAGQVNVLGRRPPVPADVREDIGVVLDRPSLVEDWTLDEVERALRPFYRRWDGDRYTALLSAFALDRGATVRQLSRGMTVKLQIAVALSHRARLLLLDEPTTGLDPVAREDVITILENLVRDGSRSVLFSTHITADLERIADHLTVLHQGRVVHTGTRDALLDAFRLVRGRARDVPRGWAAPLHGLRRSGDGFEALVARADVPRLPAGVVADRPGLDQILVHLGRGATGSAAVLR